MNKKINNVLDLFEDIPENKTDEELEKEYLNAKRFSITFVAHNLPNGWTPEEARSWVCEQLKQTEILDKCLNSYPKVEIIE